MKQAMRVTAACLSVPLTFGACGPGDCSAAPTTFGGIQIEMHRAVYVPTGTISVTVCRQTECGSGSQKLRPFAHHPHHRRDRVITFGKSALGRAFSPGPVTVTLTVTGPDGQPVARLEQQMTLRTEYPEGKNCHGGGDVTALLLVTAKDRTAA